MSKYVKNLITDHLRDQLQGVEDALLVNVVGLDSISTSRLRKELRQKNIHVVVVKNSLAARAAAGTHLAPMFEGLTGTSAICWGGEDIISLAKEVVKLAKDDKLPAFSARGGVMDGERLSAEQNLEFFGRAWRMPTATRRERIRELLTQFELWDRRKDLVGTWSRGMKQKLAVARTVLHRPQLVFLDEPTAGLDPVASAALREDLARLSADEGVTIFLTTHNLSEAERLCARIGVIRKGRLLAVGTPRELRARELGSELRLVAHGEDALFEGLLALPGVRSVRRDGDEWRVLLDDGTSAAPLVRRLVEGGVEVEEVRRDRPSLEEAFLDLVSSDESRGAGA
jgi:ABC-2 type transport system ATP-binding protein